MHQKCIVNKGVFTGTSSAIFGCGSLITDWSIKLSEGLGTEIDWGHQAIWNKIAALISQMQCPIDFLWTITHHTLPQSPEGEW